MNSTASGISDRILLYPFPSAISPPSTARSNWNTREGSWEGMVNVKRTVVRKLMVK